MAAKISITLKAPSAKAPEPTPISRTVPWADGTITDLEQVALKLNKQ
jgi:hypothetical protein